MRRWASPRRPAAGTMPRAARFTTFSRSGGLCQDAPRKASSMAVRPPRSWSEPGRDGGSVRRTGPSGSVMPCAGSSSQPSWLRARPRRLARRWVIRSGAHRPGRRGLSIPRSEITMQGSRLAGAPSSTRPIPSTRPSGWDGSAMCTSKRKQRSRQSPRSSKPSSSSPSSRFAQLLGIFTVMLGEARRVTGNLEMAAELTRQGLEVTSRTHWPFGVGWAQLVLGRIAQARGDFSEAETRLGEALRAFDSMENRYFGARAYLDLAKLAHVKGDRAAIASHLGEARRRFQELAVPRYVELGETLAAALLP